MKNMVSRLTVLIFLTSIIGFSASAQVGPDLEQRLNQGPDTERIDVIIQTAGASDQAAEAVRNAGGNVNKRFSIIDGVAVTIPKVAARNIAERNFVERVDPDFEMTTVLDSTASQINAEEAWTENATGKDVDVAVLDTGISNSNSVLDVEDEVDFTGEGTDDGNGHGTHVAGIIASQDDTYTGISYDADLFDVKVLSSDGTGSASDVIEGIQWAVENNADVISLSLGAPVEQCDGEDALSEAINNAYAQGTLPVVAAGNEGPDSGTITVPGCAENALTVGSVGSSNQISSFSSRGPTADGRVKPDVVAPGESVTSTWNDGGFETASGTSMATPHVSGTAAVLFAQNSSLTVEQAKSVVMNGSEDLGFAENDQGEGLVDVYEAYQHVVTENSTNETNQTENFAPVIEEASPISEIVNNTDDAEGVDVDLSATVSDNDSENLSVTFSFANDTEIENFTGASPLEAEHHLENLPENTSYEWYVEASDGNTTVVTEDLPFTTAADYNKSENETRENETRDNETRNRTSLPPGLQEKEELPPAFTNETPANPRSFTYGFRRAMESVSLALTFDPEKKAQKRLKYAERRLAEASTLEEDNPVRQQLLRDYQQNIQQAQDTRSENSSEENDSISDRIRGLERAQQVIAQNPGQGNPGGPESPGNSQDSRNRTQDPEDSDPNDSAEAPENFGQSDNRPEAGAPENEGDSERQSNTSDGQRENAVQRPDEGNAPENPGRDQGEQEIPGSEAPEAGEDSERSDSVADESPENPSENTDRQDADEADRSGSDSPQRPENPETRSSDTDDSGSPESESSESSGAVDNSPENPQTSSTQGNSLDTSQEEQDDPEASSETSEAPGSSGNSDRGPDSSGSGKGASGSPGPGSTGSPRGPVGMFFATFF